MGHENKHQLTWRLAELVLWAGVALILYRLSAQNGSAYWLEGTLAPLLVVGALTLAMRTLPLEAMWLAFSQSRPPNCEDRLEAWFGKFAWTIISSNLLYAVLMGFTIWFAIKIEPPADAGWHPGVLVVLAITIGWVTGTLLSPIGETESTTFLRSTQAVITFLGGYATSQYAEKIKDVGFNAVMLTMVELFASALITTALIVYINRSYFRPDPTARPQQDSNGKSIPLDTNTNITEPQSDAKAS